MGIVVRQSLFSSVFSYFGVLLGFLNVIFLFPLILSPEEFGLTRYLISFATLASSVSLLGMPQVLIKYNPFYRIDKRNNGLLFFTFAFASVGAFVVVLSVLFLSDVFISNKAENQLIEKNFLLVLPLIFGMVYFQIFADYLRANFKTVFPIFVQEVLQRVFITLLLSMVYFSFLDFGQFILLFSVLYLALYIVILVYCFFTLGVDLRPVNFNFKFVKSAMVFGLFSLLTGLSNTLVINIDQLMVTYLSKNGLADTAVYSVAIYVAAVIAVPFKNINNVIAPLISKAFKENNLQEVESLYKKSANTLFVIAGFIFLLILINQPLLFYILPEPYAAGAWVLFWVGLSKVFDSANGCNGAIINYSQYFRYSTWFLLGLAVLTVITNLIFIPLYGITGAGMATGISIFAYNLVKWYFIRLKFGHQPFDGNMLRVLVVFVALYAMVSFLPSFSNLWVNAFFKSGLVSLLFAFLVMKTTLSVELKTLFQKIVQLKFKNF
ncbi:MAG: oligosaccharide flippase family protein [Luteibaculaceae bacterium]